MRVRVIGIGSPAGDDQAGWRVVDALAARAVTKPGTVLLEKLDRPGAALIERFSGADCVILVDAVDSGAAPGRIHRLRAADWAAYRGGVSSHGFGVFDALALAQALQALPPRLEVYGIEIASAGAGEAPGPAVCAAVARLADQLAALLERGI
jgi:hydrogenase maturation protease